MSARTCSDKDLQRALEGYGLVAQDFDLLRKSQYAEVYRTPVDGTDFVVRVRCPEARAEDVIFTHQWTQAISAEVPVPVSLLPVGEVPKIGHGFVKVCPYIEHEDIEGKFMGPEAWTKVGEWVGRMHRLGQDVIDQAPQSLDYGNHPNEVLFNRYLQQSRIGELGKHSKILARVERLVDLSEKAIAGNTLPISVVHGDMHFWNVLYDKGDPVAIIDFDFLQRGILLYDLAYASIWLSTWEEEKGFQKSGGERWLGITERYFEAYGVGRDMPVTQEERDCLAWLRIRIHLLFFFDNVRFSWNRLGKAMRDLESAEDVFKSLS